MSLFTRLPAILSMLVLSAGIAAADPLQLLMFEREGCIYCKQWNEEIAPIYPKTAQGEAAPLRRLDITAPLPADVTLTGRRPAFTPTFVLTRDGTEVARLEGYAGDEFFWVLLDGMLGRAGWSADPAAAETAAPVSATD
ncbi:hypothetical protein [Paracoccus sp. S-4012]|uniref:hypothetical protein n=1 Tax=Paracoccus sp. S-4012 TaxID=2665648 RepID=UPI0018A1E8D1|nr:hypothetical protein [Paracoccus sp. S-4012]